MKKYLPFLFLLPFAAFADEAPDSVAADETPTELHEIVVEGSNQSLNAEVATYIPVKRAKNAAQDATSLLFHMSIPQLNVNPLDGSVKNNMGQDVALFIDYVPADAQDLKGMRTQDVKRVEYYTYPTDPRFRGARYAINFVMQQYEWGGYTKVTGQKVFYKNINYGSIFSKFKYRRITYDLFVSENYSTNRHNGSELRETFNFDDLYGNGPQTVERLTTTDGSRYRSNSNHFSLRANYETAKFQMSHRLSFNLFDNPRNSSTSSVSYYPAIAEATKATSVASANNKTLGYSGWIYYAPVDNLSMNFNLSYDYNHNKSFSTYTLAPLIIDNNAAETAHSFDFAPEVSWRFSDKHRLGVQAGISHSWSDIDYTGTAPSRQKYEVGGYHAAVGYSFTLPKFNAGGYFGWTWNISRISGIEQRQNSPYVSVFASWSPDRRNQVYVYTQFLRHTPSASQKSANMLQADELLWYAGNPLLTDYIDFSPGLSYTWVPNNRWQLTVDGTYSLYKDPIISRYTPEGPDGTMLRRYVNSGDIQAGTIGLNGVARFFKRSLVLQVQPRYWMRHRSGEYAWHRNELTCSVQLSYYLGNFNFIGYYVTPFRQQTRVGVVERLATQYFLQAGWGNSDWNISVRASNFARSSWETSRNSLSSKYYSYEGRMFGANFHASYNITVTYIFGYGKKINRGNELSGDDSGSSAILK